jgi:Tfp pilus assembly protein PilN
MRAVNLVPEDARRRGAARGSGRRLSLDSLGFAHFIVGVLAIVALLVLLRVVAENGVNDKKATLAAVQSQVTVEQSRLSQYSTFTSFVQAAEQREAQVREIAAQRFPWQRTLDQISVLMPASTSLTNLSATTSGATASSTSTGSTAGAGSVSSGPSFTLTGCANTPNQNGVATLLRRLQHLSGVTGVGFQSSSRAASCGNQFSLNLSFGASGETAAVGTASTSAAAAGTTTTTTGAAG